MALVSHVGYAYVQYEGCDFDTQPKTLGIPILAIHGHHRWVGTSDSLHSPGGWSVCGIQGSAAESDMQTICHQMRGCEPTTHNVALCSIHIKHMLFLLQESRNRSCEFMLTAHDRPPEPAHAISHRYGTLGYE